MNELEMNLKEAVDSICDGIDDEILKLKHFMEAIDEERFNQTPESMAKICDRIFYAAEGLKKLVSVLEYVDCWTENGDPPQLSRDARFERYPAQEINYENLKDWQKETILSEDSIP